MFIVLRFLSSETYFKIDYRLESWNSKKGLKTVSENRITGKLDQNSKSSTHIYMKIQEWERK